MSKQNEDTNLKSVGLGKGIIEVLNIGFEPLLTDEEYELYLEIGEKNLKKRDCEKSIDAINEKLAEEKEEDKYSLQLMEELETISKELENVKEQLNSIKERFKKELKRNISKVRKVYTDEEREYKKEDQYRNILLFESSLTRAFGCVDMDRCDDIISVVTYYTEIFNGIVHNGFTYKDKKFVFFTAGAGQTRNKKSTFVSEEMLLEKQNTLFCGLTRERVNELGGMNTNKYLAYTSLCQTNSAIWKGFDIDRSIVVPDIEYNLPEQKVRYIYTETQEDKDEMSFLKKELREKSAIQSEYNKKRKELPKGTKRSEEEILSERQRKNEIKELKLKINELYSKYHRTSIKTMPITIPFTDGFGVSLIKMPSSMVRLPFVKGLISYLDRDKFKKFCSKNGYKIGKITDIYGKSHDINDVDYIFTESQFKMYKYYRNVVDENGNVLKTGWEVYKDNFKKYNCEACVCNVEGKVKLNAKTNYQVLQTLTTEMTNKEILELARYDINNINGIGRDIDCMLNVMGANEDKNNRMNWLQKSLLVYPEMFKDSYVKNLLMNTKDSMIKKFRSGKFNINGAYTFAIPDPVACLQWWFCKERNLDKLGIVEDGKVCCHLFRNNEKVDCLRSPHLDHSHCIRRNMKTSETKLYFETNGIYIGVKDNMSKFLMFDNDGDHLLVHNNHTIIGCAERFQSKYKMFPNYYDMPKANPEKITNDTLFNGIVMAYHHGNIGTPSNEITKIFAKLSPKSTDEEIKQAIEIVALRCCDVNFVIDYAKTLYKPEIPKDIINQYKKYSKSKVPNFFIYAKGKKADQVEEKGINNIDRISDIVEDNSKRIYFKNLLGKYSYLNMMNNSIDSNISEELKNEIIKLYNETNEANIRKLQYKANEVVDIKEKDKIKMQIEFDSKKQKQMFLELFPQLSKDVIVNVLVKELNKKINRDLLWRLFGEEIYNNICENLKGTVVCKKCHERFTKDEVKRGMCPDCRKDANKKSNGMKNEKCIDCGEEFVIDLRVQNRCRCDHCLKEEKKRQKREWARKHKK